MSETYDTTGWEDRVRAIVQERFDQSLNMNWRSAYRNFLRDMTSDGERNISVISHRGAESFPDIKDLMVFRTDIRRIHLYAQLPSKGAPPVIPPDALVKGKPGPWQGYS